MKVVKRILVIIISIILGLICAFSIYNFVCIKVLKQDLVSIKGYAILEVVSGSMEPTIHVGDMIIIDTNETSYNSNDIITFYDVNGSFVTHRIMSIDDGMMITRGDNNNSNDEPTNVDKIVGKYVFKLSNVGKILAAFRNPLIMLLILVGGILVCVLISTDKNGKPIMSNDDKEYQEFLEYQNKKEKKKSKKRKKELVLAIEAIEEQREALTDLTEDDIKVTEEDVIEKVEELKSEISDDELEETVSPLELFAEEISEKEEDIEAIEEVPKEKKRKKKEKKRKEKLVKVKMTETEYQEFLAYLENKESTEEEISEEQKILEHIQADAEVNEKDIVLEEDTSEVEEKEEVITENDVFLGKEQEDIRNVLKEELKAELKQELMEELKVELLKEMKSEKKKETKKTNSKVK